MLIAGKARLVGEIEVSSSKTLFYQFWHHLY